MRYPQHCLPSLECIQLLHLRGRRTAAVGRIVSENWRGRRLVRVRTALRARVHAWQALRLLGADDHFHGGFGARSGYLYYDHDPSLSRAGHDSEPDADPFMGEASHLDHGDLCHALCHGGQFHAVDGPDDQYPVF